MRSMQLPRYPGLFLQMLLAWVAAPLFIRLLPLPLLLKAYSPRCRFAFDEQRIRRIPRYFEMLCRLVFLGKAQECLRRCLVLFYFLNRWGEPVVIRFGIRSGPSDRGVGHSWLTRPDGSLWGKDPRAAEFSPMAVFHWKGDGIRQEGVAHETSERK